MAFSKSSMFIFFLMALVLCQQSIALGSSAKDTQNSVDNLHVEQRRVMKEGPNQGSSNHGDSPVFTSDAPPSDSMILPMLGIFCAVAGLLYFGSYYFILFIIAIAVVFTGFVVANS
ncbi:hypothetical protein ACLB2K_040803 [Fragaria x ananassa]